MDSRILARAAETAAGGERAVLVTLVATEGPAPRAPGARMLLFGRGRTEGTIGGGALEAHAVERAAGLLSQGEGTELETVNLTDRGLKCGGGRVTLFYEVLAPEAQLAIFGAGHVGRAVAALAQGVGLFPVVVYDARESAGGEAAPGIPVTVVPGYGELPRLSERAYAVVCTDSHATDLQVARGLLAQSPGPAYVGMLGSQKKSADIRAKLVADGIPAERAAVLRSPVGLPLGGRSPGLLALSILAEVVAFHHGALTEAQARLAGRTT